MVTLNSFLTDTPAETDLVRDFCQKKGCDFALSQVWARGGEGGIPLAEKVLEVLENKKSEYHPLYEPSLPLEEKIKRIADKIYGADGVDYSPAARRQLQKIVSMGMNHFAVCMAKTQYSLSDDAGKLGRPEHFRVTVREIYPAAGAGFVVVVLGNIMTMPGLPRVPAANHIDVTDDSVITGLF